MGTGAFDFPRDDGHGDPTVREAHREAPPGELSSIDGTEGHFQVHRGRLGSDEALPRRANLDHGVAGALDAEQRGGNSVSERRAEFVAPFGDGRGEREIGRGHAVPVAAKRRPSDPLGVGVVIGLEPHDGDGELLAFDGFVLAAEPPRDETHAHAIAGGLHPAVGVNEDGRAFEGRGASVGAIGEAPLNRPALVRRIDQELQGPL